MALKKPGELLDGKTPKPNVVESVKEEFNKVEDLRKQLDSVSNSLNNSLTEVVDKNLSFLSNEYNDLLDKFSNKVAAFKEEIVYKVDGLKKENLDLRTDIRIVEKRQDKVRGLDSVNINKIKEEVLTEVQDVLSGDVARNIKKLERKIEIVRESYQKTINEGLLNEPPKTNNSDPLTPADQKFATFQDLNKHYTLFINRIQQQLSTLGGGGAVRIQDLDDVDIASAKVNNKYLKFNSTSGKWEGADASGGGSGISNVVEDTTPQLGGNLDLNSKEITGTGGINITGISTFNDDVVFTGASTNARWDKSKNDLVLYNDTRLTLGNNDDFQMWHGGTHTFVKNTGGDLRIRGDKILLKREDDTERYLEANKNEDVKLFYNGVEKFGTTREGINVLGISSSTGVRSSGIVTATSFVGDGSGLTGIVGSGSGVVVKDSDSLVGTAGTINFGNNLSVSAISAGIVTVTGQAGTANTSHVRATTLTVAGVTTHYQDVQFPGAAYNILWDQATSKFKFDDSAQCVWGSASGGDLKIFHQSGNSSIRNETGQFRIAGNDIRIQTQNHSEDYILCTDGGAVQLFFNDNEKLATTNAGIDVIGHLDVSDSIFVANNIKHLGDTDTYIEFTADQMRFIAGGKALIHAEEASIDTVIINDGSNDLDFRVEGQNDEHLIFSDGSTDRVGIGSAIPTQKLDVDGAVKATTYYGDGSNLSGVTGALDSRGTTSAATGSIAQTASADITIPTRGKSFTLLKVAIDAPAWVVLYVDSASRSSDSGRTEGTDPAPGSGVLTEVSTTTSGASTFLMSPAVLGWNNDSTPAAQVYAKVTNKRATSGSNAITVTLTTVKLEA